jgi:hypothetical protein
MKSHAELLSAFVKRLYQKAIFKPEQLKKIVLFADELYAVKEGVDCYGLSFSRNHASKIEEYVSKVKSLILSYEFRRI